MNKQILKLNVNILIGAMSFFVFFLQVKIGQTQCWLSVLKLKVAQLSCLTDNSSIFHVSVASADEESAS